MTRAWKSRPRAAKASAAPSSRSSTTTTRATRHPIALDGGHGLKRRASGRRHVVDDHDVHPGLERAFHQLPGPVPLGFLSDEEPEKTLPITKPSRRQGRPDDRIGPHRQAADGPHVR